MNWTPPTIVLLLIPMWDVKLLLQLLENVPLVMKIIFWILSPRSVNSELLKTVKPSRLLKTNVKLANLDSGWIPIIMMNVKNWQLWWVVPFMIKTKTNVWLATQIDSWISCFASKSLMKLQIVFSTRIMECVKLAKVDSLSPTETVILEMFKTVRTMPPPTPVPCVNPPFSWPIQPLVLPTVPIWTVPLSTPPKTDVLLVLLERCWILKETVKATDPTPIVKLLMPMDVWFAKPTSTSILPPKPVFREAI